MGVLAKKKIYPTANEEAPSQPIGSSNQQQQSGVGGPRTVGRLESRLNSQSHGIQLNRTYPQQSSLAGDESQRFNSAKRNRTFIIRKAFQSGLNQLSSTIKRPVNHGRLTKLDSNNVELIQSKHRTNGWSPPIHPLQVAAAFVFLLMTGLLFYYLLPMISLENERLIYLIYAACILITVVHLILHIVAISINPADDNVIAKQRNQPSKPLPAFDRAQHKHVIENQFCYICECPVSSSRSKHCSRCNVCIEGFDHHCNWLNTCIGSKNYKLFISSVISALLGSSIIFGLSVLFIVCWANSSCAWLDNPYLNGGLDYGADTDDSTFDNATSPTDTFATSRLTAQLANLSTTPLSLISDPATSMSSLLTTINSTIDADYDNFTDSPSSTTTDDETEDAGNSLQYQTIIHLCVIFMSLILSAITVILLLHLLCFHLFLNCIGLSTYEFIVQRREAAQRNLNQEDSPDQPTCNERILRCLACQSDFLLPKSQSELATSQSIVEKGANHASQLARKRQLSQQMSNESRMSRNSKESSGHYSSRTVSLYEDFDKAESAVANKISLAENDSSSQVYLGSPQKQQRRAFEEWKTLNNRSLTAGEPLASSKEAAGSYFENHLKQLNETQLNERAHNVPPNNGNLASGNLTSANLASATTLASVGRPLQLDARLAELNTNNLLIHERLEPLGGAFTGDRSMADKNSYHSNDTGRNLSASRKAESLAGDETRSEHSRNDQSRNDQSRNDQSRNDQSKNEHSELRDDQIASEPPPNQSKSGVQFKDDFLNDKPINQIDSQTVNKYLDNLDEFINQQLNGARNRGHSPTADQIVSTKTVENNNGSNG